MIRRPRHHLRRARRRTQHARPVVVTLTMDATQFVDQMRAVGIGFREAKSTLRLRQRIAHERTTGLAHVRHEADRVRRELGLEQPPRRLPKLAAVIDSLYGTKETT